VIVAVPHEPYLTLDDNYFSGITKQHGLIADLKGLYRNKITKRNYWSL
jgi:UDP-N-acetyl-D-galactosamine dehydrogenase